MAKKAEVIKVNKVEKQKTLVKTESSSPAEIIASAIAGGADLEKLKGLMELQERWEGNEAKKEYHKAMAAFKANPPEINKDKQVSYNTGKGKTEYKHASLANVCNKINSELSKHGLSASWTTRQNGSIAVTCKITHIKGHSEETTLAAGADTTGSKNSIQAIGSTITYLERYTLLSLTGLATFEQEDDGMASENGKPELKKPEALDKGAPAAPIAKKWPQSEPNPALGVQAPTSEPQHDSEATQEAEEITEELIEIDVEFVNKLASSSMLKGVSQNEEIKKSFKIMHLALGKDEFNSTLELFGLKSIGAIKSPAMAKMILQLMVKKATK